MLSPGAGVVTSRGLIRYVVSEYGVAFLHGKSIRQRAQALIDIAHPKFREELYQFCEKTKWLQRPLTAEPAGTR
jgi:acyl-CoA hydrolase